MKTILWSAAAIAMIGIAYSLGPDIRRYIKIKSM